jgi:hypothetical protein
VPDLSPSQLDAILDATRAVVDRDPTRLTDLLGGADALKRWSSGEEQFGAELSMPPGPPSEWAIEALVVSSSRHLVHVVVPVSSDGSDLQLELLLTMAGAAEWVATIHSLTLIK